MLSSELESCLNGAFAQAREARHEFLTVEHLLLSIIDAPRVLLVVASAYALSGPLYLLWNKAGRKSSP